MRSLPAGDDHRPHLGVLEADALERVGELEVDAEVVAVELERVAGAQPLVLADVHHQASDLAAVLGRELEAPVAVAVGVGLEADGGERVRVVRVVDVGAHGSGKLTVRRRREQVV